MSQTRTPAQEIEEARQAMRLHNLGLTERQIADRMTIENSRFISQSTVHRRLEKYVEIEAKPDIQASLLVELATCDTRLEMLAPAVSYVPPPPKDAKVGETKEETLERRHMQSLQIKAIQQAEAISKRRSELLGLTRPVAASGAEPSADATVAARIEAAKAERKLRAV